MARHGENIRKRKDGRWEARYICGYQENGRAKYKSIYGKTYLEVRNAKRAMDAEQILPGPIIKSTEITYGTLLEDWLETIRIEVKESTYSRYVFLIDRHIKPELGKIRLAKLTAAKIEYFIYQKLQDGRLDGKGGLSPKTVSGLVSVIRLSLIFAENRNYGCMKTASVKNPRQTPSRMQILSEEEQKKLESCIMERFDTIHMGILVSLYTGLRIGEICALRWGDIDEEGGTLTVQRTLMRIQNTDEIKFAKTKLIMDTPKTECSSRMIPIPSFLSKVLEMNRKRDSAYILTGSERYLEPRRYYSKYKKILEECGLQRFTYHTLRHTFATRCIENGFDLKSLSEILGHANVSTTLQRYVHPSMNLKRRHMEQLEKISICGHKSGHPER